MSHPTARDLLGHRLSGAVRQVTLTECTCGAPVWIGWDEDFGALPAVADTTPIDGLTEVAVWLAGRHTYVLMPCATTGRKLSVRSEAMTAKGAGQPPHRSSPVVAEHCCEEWA